MNGKAPEYEVWKDTFNLAPRTKGGFIQIRNLKMRIGLIRHLPVNYPFLNGLVSQSEMLKWFEEYNAAPVIEKNLQSVGSWNLCYSSELSRAKTTAAFCFKGDIVYSPFLNEPFPSPLFKRDIRLPFILWALVIRLAILFNHSSQLLGKSIVEERIKGLLKDILINKDSNVLIISHAFIMESMSKLLIKEGFRGKHLNMPQHGVLYLYTKD